ncbi:MAG: PKD domain-containing protein [Bacteroidia bacterium]
MKRSITAVLLLVGLAGIFTGCEEAPEPCFTIDANLVDVNTDVLFSNCTEPLGQSYTWTFDDGTTSTEFSPTHRFTAERQYVVALSAKGKTTKSTRAFETLITAGQRILSIAQIESLPSTNTSGGAWDAGDNPDIAVRFSKAGTTMYQSPTLNNAALSFPIAITTPASLVLSPTTWTVTVLDIDSGSEEVMATFSQDLLSFEPSASEPLTLNLAAGNASMKLTYTLR